MKITTRVRNPGNYTWVTVKMKLDDKKVSWSVRVGTLGAGTVREAHKVAMEKARKAFDEINNG